jgi:sugar lactone lactonase YvrE
MKKAALFLLCALAISFGAQGSVWEQKTLEDFASGKLTNLSITGAGEVRLAPALNLLAKTQELFIWSMVEDRDGTVYIGTGNEGKIFRIDSRGNSKEIYDSPETGILSMVIDRSGNIFAGAMPSGIIYKITPRGEAKVFYDTEDSYIWALCFDNSGSLYAGTGNKGRIYKISPAGEGKVLYESNEPHILSLLATDGALYASSSGDGLIYKIKDGKVVLLYDADEPEARSLVGDKKGNIYFATNPGEANTTQSQQSSSRLYRIRPDGITEYLWTAPDSLILSMIVDPDGNLLVGTGNKGKIYRINGNGEETILTQCEETQVLALYRSDKTVLVATGNLGSVYRLGPASAQTGTIDSYVFDTGTISRWGRIDWQGSTPSATEIILETKSGNRKEPDPTWNTWARPEADKIKNPPARFVQWRATLKTQKPGTSPVLKKVSVSYLPANLKPEVTSISLSKPGGNSGGSSDYSEKKPEKTERKISWSGWDPNGDSLVFKIYFKGTGERNWKLIKEDIADRSYALDTQTLPDGWYEIKVVASDSPDNPGDLALSGEKVSDPFLVNNTPARIENLKANPAAQNKHRITFTATSALSPLRSSAYSLNAGKWLPLAPADGIFDSKSESFSFETKLATGEWTVVVKVEDEFNNVSTAKQVIEAR